MKVDNHSGLGAYCAEIPPNYLVSVLRRAHHSLTAKYTDNGQLETSRASSRKMESWLTRRIYPVSSSTDTSGCCLRYKVQTRTTSNMPSLSTIPTGLLLEIISHLPWYHLYALRLTSQHFYNLIGPRHDGNAQYPPSSSVYYKAAAGDSRAIVASAWGSDNDIWFCGMC